MEPPVELPKQPCRNCDYLLPHGAKYCPHCGQKNTNGKVTVWQFIKDVFDTLFNIDSRFFRTLGAIFVPGKLTIEYFKGRHKKYAPPFRLFFILGLIHFTLIGLVSYRNIKGPFSEMTERGRSAASRLDILEEITELKETVVDQTEKDPVARKAMDVLYSTLKGKDNGRVVQGVAYYKFNGNQNFELDAVEIPQEEIFRFTEEEIFEKYELPHDFLNKAFIKQELRLMKNPDDFVRFAIGQSIWMVLMMMFALGLILKLLYVRRKRYYVEHLVFSFHYHAFAFLIVTFPFLAIWWRPDLFDEDSVLFTLSWAFFGILIYLYFAMKRVYRQGWFKTFIKFSILNVSYLFIFTLFLVLSFILSLFFF